MHVNTYDISEGASTEIKVTSGKMGRGPKMEVMVPSLSIKFYIFTRRL